MLGKTEGKRRRGRERMRWLGSITNVMDMNLRKFWEIMKDEEPGILQSMGSQRVGHHLATEQQGRNIWELGVGTCKLLHTEWITRYYCIS